MPDDQKNSPDYPAVESVITNIVKDNKKPSLDAIKHQLNISENTFDEIIDYYLYMWEQRHMVTYLETLEPLNPSKFKNEDFVKRTMQLEESLAMMRATIEATEDCLLMINKQGKLIGLNKKLIEFVGLPPEVLTSKDEAEGLKYLFNQIENPQELAELVNKKYHDPTPGSCGEMRFKDGRTVERFYQPQIVNNEVVGHVWSLRDITKRKEQEESLRLTNRAIYASTHGIVLIENNPEFHISYLNPASEVLLNVSGDDSMNKPLWTIADVFLDHQQEFLDIFTKKIKGELTLQCQINTKMVWLDIHIDPVHDKDQKEISHFVCIINDITQSKELENILQYKAVHDALTGLPNKTYIEDAIHYRIEKAETEHDIFGLLFIDIDRFKNINDTLGHRVGDKLLCLFSERIQKCLQKKDIIARIGGDEFLVLLDSVNSVDDIHTMAERLLITARQKFINSDHEFNITISIGIVNYPDSGKDSETLIRNADIAMYQAKQNGRNRICFYSTSLKNVISRRVQIENELHNAIKENQLELFYQPIFNIEKNKFIKAEALLRWNNKKLGAISPVEFIPVIEDIGMMNSIGRWIIETAIHQQRVWEEKSIDISVSLNVSAKQLSDESFMDHLRHIIRTNHVKPENTIIEITESFLLLHEKVTANLGELNNIGVKIAIDDFGTGYSNLSYLNKLRVAFLKIDKSFIDQIEMPNFNNSIINAIVAIAKSMNFKIVAEGVETQRQFEFLKNLGCHDIQGFYFSKPLSALDFEAFILKNR